MMRSAMRWGRLASLALVAFVCASALATSTGSKTSSWERPIWMGTRYADPDSGDVVRRYPSQEADTTGQGTNLSYYRETTTGDSIAMWYFTFQTGEVWDFYLNGVLIPDISGRYLAGTRVSEGSIVSSTAFAAGVVDSAALAPGAAVQSLLASSSTAGSLDLGGSIPDSMMIVPRLTVTSQFNAPGFEAGDGTLTATAPYYGTSMDLSGGLVVDDDTHLGNSDGDDHVIQGHVQLTQGMVINDAGLFVGGDSLWVDGRLYVAEDAIVQDSLVVGAAGDTATVALIIENGFPRYKNSIIVTVPALGTQNANPVPFPGATADMVFDAKIISGSGSTLVLNLLAVKYDSPGHVEWFANSIASSRTFLVYGYRY